MSTKKGQGRYVIYTGIPRPDGSGRSFISNEGTPTRFVSKAATFSSIKEAKAFATRHKIPFTLTTYIGPRAPQ
jgi:hypothetical protein